MPGIILSLKPKKIVFKVLNIFQFNFLLFPPFNFISCNTLFSSAAMTHNHFIWHKIYSLDKVEAEQERRAEEREVLERELQRLEGEVAARDEEIKTMGGGVSALVGVSVNGASVLDVSVDGVALEELSGSNSPTPKKILPHTPLSRGPSASSTPNRSRRGSLGSIIDELKDASFNNGLPSPFCGKGLPDQNLFKMLQQEIGKWQESVRRAIIAEADPGQTRTLISAVNKVMDGARKEIICKIERTTDDDVGTIEELRAEIEELKKELSTCREELEKEREAAARERERTSDLEMVEGRVTDMACLLQAANRALLAAGHSVSRDVSRSGSPLVTATAEATVEEDLLVDWQLDLEGIELLEWNNNLSRKLFHYSKQLREEVSKVESSRLEQRAEDGKPGKVVEGKQRLWLSSLFNRLEELHLETEKSR